MAHGIERLNDNQTEMEIIKKAVVAKSKALSRNSPARDEKIY
jgi:hypothetical protein